MHARGYNKGRHAREKGEGQMMAFLCLEASQPGRSSYRLALGLYVPPGMASVLLLLLRLF